MSTRLPAHLEASAIIRRAEAQGGSAMVLAKGERDAGTILLVMIGRGEPGVLYERMPQLDGSRSFVATKREDPDMQGDFPDYLARRRRQDPDIWLIEVSIADPERFIAGCDETS